MRKTMNISVSEEMYSFILNRMRSECHASVSEYIRALVRRDGLENRDRFAEQKKLSAPRRANDYFTNAAVPDDEL